MVVLFECRCIKGEPDIEEYYEMYLEAEKHNSEISEAVMQTDTAREFLTPGRVVVVKSQSVSPCSLLMPLFSIISCNRNLIKYSFGCCI